MVSYILAVASVISLANISWSALAYIDPSTGGQLFQLLALVFAFFSGFIFFFSRQIKAILARFKRFVNEKIER